MGPAPPDLHLFVPRPRRHGEPGDRVDGDGGVPAARAEVLQERLEGKADLDIDTARRLFTLVCVLHFGG